MLFKLYKEQQQELKADLEAYFKKAMASGELVVLILLSYVSNR